MGYLKTMAMAVVAAVLVVAMAAETQDCISKLTACGNSLNATKPTETCCSSIKDAVEKELPCLCNVYTTPGLLESLGVTLNQALNLTKACGVPTDISKCNSTLSPNPQPPAAVSLTEATVMLLRIWTSVTRAVEYLG